MSLPIVELSADELVDDADRTNEMLDAVRVAHGPHRLVPAPRPRLLSLGLPPVIVEVPEDEDVESAARTLQMRRPSSTSAVAVAIPVDEAPMFPPEPKTEPRLLELVDDDLVDDADELPQVDFLTPEPDAGPYPSVAPASIELTYDRVRAYRAPVSGVWIAMGVVSVCAIIGVLAGGLTAYRHQKEASAASTTVSTAAVAPKQTAVVAPVLTHAPSKVQDTKPTFDVNALPVATPASKPSLAATSSPKPTAAPKAKTAKSDATKPASEPAAETKATPAAEAKVETGMVRTFSSAAGKTITVNGKEIGEAGAPIAVACGHHSIAVGDARARDYDVPCHGAITVGTP